MIFNVEGYIIFEIKHFKSGESMRITDISVTVPYVPTYPGDPDANFKQILTIKNGSVCNLTELSMSVHAGTHADAPLHFIDGGAAIDTLPPDLFCGAVRVVTIYKTTGNIEADDIVRHNIGKGERILFRTRNSIDGHIFDKDFYADFCGLSPSAARYLVNQEIILAGIDYASIGAGKDTVETHRILLGAGVAVLEWLNLSEVDHENYILFAAPMKLAAEGAPVRALLIDK